MKVRPKSSISAPDGPRATARTRPPEPPDRQPDAVQISQASDALNQTEKVHHLTAAVGAGTYEISSEETSHALVEDALLKPI
jgi:anti-sigma28 factor (negative regulator of flagellin synthesis)